MVELGLPGKHKEALELQLKYLAMENALLMDVNPIPVKEAMNLMGKNVGECRLPLIKMEEAKVEKLRAALRNAGII